MLTRNQLNAISAASIFIGVGAALTATAVPPLSMFGLAFLGSFSLLSLATMLFNEADSHPRQRESRPLFTWHSTTSARPVIKVKKTVPFDTTPQHSTIRVHGPAATPTVIRVEKQPVNTTRTKKIFKPTHTAAGTAIPSQATDVYRVQTTQQVAPKTVVTTTTAAGTVIPPNATDVHRFQTTKSPVASIAATKTPAATAAVTSLPVHTEKKVQTVKVTPAAAVPQAPAKTLLVKFDSKPSQGLPAKPQTPATRPFGESVLSDKVIVKTSHPSAQPVRVNQKDPAQHVDQPQEIQGNRLSGRVIVKQRPN